MKLLRWIVGAVVVAGLAIWGITVYLGPDDLRSCEVAPSAKPGCAKADAIVAVSGGDTAARAREAIRLYKAGWAPTIIFSGAAADKSGPSNAEVMQAQAIQAGVPARDVIIEANSTTTTENATETSNIFKQRGITSAILVTSGYHMRRATLEFDKRSLGVKVRSHPVAVDKHWSGWWWLTPTGWWLAVPELVSSLIVAAGGRIR